MNMKKTIVTAVAIAAAFFAVFSASVVLAENLTISKKAIGMKGCLEEARLTVGEKASEQKDVIFFVDTRMIKHPETGVDILITVPGSEEFLFAGDLSSAAFEAATWCQNKWGFLPRGNPSAQALAYITN